MNSHSDFAATQNGIRKEIMLQTEELRSALTAMNCRLVKNMLLFLSQVVRESGY